jgi:hypothetical protein
MKIKVMIVAGLVAMAVGGTALTGFMKTFQSTYAIAKDSHLSKEKCMTCHDTKLPTKAKHVLNAYGLALQKEMKAEGTKKLNEDVLEKVGKLDSDGDGMRNADEIKKDRLPGDPKG